MSKTLSLPPEIEAAVVEYAASNSMSRDDAIIAALDAWTRRSALTVPSDGSDRLVLHLDPDAMRQIAEAQQRGETSPTIDIAIVDG